MIELIDGKYIKDNSYGYLQRKPVVLKTVYAELIEVAKGEYKPVVQNRTKVFIKYVPERKSICVTNTKEYQLEIIMTRERANVAAVALYEKSEGYDSYLWTMTFNHTLIAAKDDKIVI